MVNIVLFEPEIPQNTGNIARTCAITGANLHLIRPLGFSLDKNKLKRSGLDYWDSVNIKLYDDFESFYKENKKNEMYIVTTKSNKSYTDICYGENVFFIFGNEGSGLNKELYLHFRNKAITIPMKKGEKLRSLNLANSVCVILYEKLRQDNFKFID